MSTERFEQFRHYLNLLARMQVGRKYLRKVDPSAVVNATLYSAERHREQLADLETAEIAAWLRKRLAFDLADAFRVLHREKRDIDREFSFEESLDNSAARTIQLLEAVQSSPSERVARKERALQLATALAQLPEPQRDVVELHHLQGHSISEVAEIVERTNASVAGLLRRGLKRLREMLDSDEL